MISPVTTSTVSPIMTEPLAGSLALIGILVLLALLIQKELFTSAGGSRFQLLGKVLNIGIAPLTIVFILFVITRLVEVLR